jgi:hypothetical protein
VKNAVVQGTEFDDADGEIEARDALERLLAFLPIDYAWSVANPDVRIRLRKRLWQDGAGDWWLLVGARTSELAALPAGAVVFDPTLTLDEGEAGADKDTAIESDNPTLNNGAQNYMYAERSSGTRKCLLEFAIESTIPAGSTIDDADLGLYVYNVDSPGTILLRNILSGNAGWTEAGATWNTVDGTNAWAGSAGCSTEGTDYSASALGSYTVTGTGAISIALATAQVAAWLSGNAGFVIYPQNQSTWNVQRFRTSEASTASERPSLTVVYTEAASGTVYTQSVAGALTPAGAMTRQAATTKSGTLTPAGSVSRRAATTKSGGVTPAGTLARQARKPTAGSVTPTGSQTRQTATTKAGVVAPAGSLTRRTSKSLAGSVTPSGVLGTIKTFLQSVAGALTPSGALARQIGKVTAGNLTPGGALARLTSTALAGVVAPVGSLVKRAAKTLSGALTPSGTLATETVADVVVRHLYSLLGYWSVTRALLGYWSVTRALLAYWKTRHDIDGEV